MNRDKPNFPIGRDLSPLREEEILKILKNIDEKNKKNPTMGYAEFLAELYRIVDVFDGESVVSTNKVVEILHLRAKREGYDFKYTKAAVINRNQNGTLYALSRKERERFPFCKFSNQFFFSLRDVLSIPLGRWPAGHKRKHKVLRYSRPGRPTRKAQAEMRQAKEELIRGTLVASNF
jgi:hypothetical protein